MLPWHPRCTFLHPSQWCRTWSTGFFLPPVLIFGWNAFRPNSDENGARTAISNVQKPIPSLPDAVLVQRVQILVGGLGLWGPTVQILEALSGADALLGRLLRDVQLAPERQAGFSTVVDKQHREAVMALQERRRNHGLLAEEEFLGRLEVLHTHQPVNQSAQKHPSSRKPTAATRLFSVMKVTHSRGSVSELRLVTLERQIKG